MKYLSIIRLSVGPMQSWSNFYSSSLSGSSSAGLDSFRLILVEDYQLLPSRKRLSPSLVSGLKESNKELPPTSPPFRASGAILS